MNRKSDWLAILIGRVLLDIAFGAFICALTAGELAAFLVFAFHSQVDFVRVSVASLISSCIVGGISFGIAGVLRAPRRTYVPPIWIIGIATAGQVLAGVALTICLLMFIYLQMNMTGRAFPNLVERYGSFIMWAYPVVLNSGLFAGVIRGYRIEEQKLVEAESTKNSICP